MRNATSARAGRLTAAVVVAVSAALAGCASDDMSPSASMLPAIAPGDVAAVPAAGADAALIDARALAANGKADEALAALAAARKTHPEDAALASEHGRLALRLGRIGEAEVALAEAEALGDRGWRLLSAQGALLAQRGKLAEARRKLEAALAEAPREPAVLNNLALLAMLEGDTDRAEKLLRQAAADTAAPVRTKQNLALVLGLQGKFGDANRIAAGLQGKSVADADILYLKSLVGGTGRVAKAEG